MNNEPLKFDGIRSLHTINRITTALVLLILVAVSTHLLSRSLGYAPPVTVDDGLMNLSTTLAEDFRYGFLSSPIQPGGDYLRSEAFYNYGPWYFMIAGLLNWLFSASLELTRAIHPLGLLAISLAGFAIIRRFSFAASALLFLGIFSAFWTTHWPMARPDIMVSVFACAGIASSYLALTQRRAVHWVLTGFCAAAAATQHQIAWAMVPWAATMWGLSVFFESKLDPSGCLNSRTHVRSFAALVFGGLIAGLFYLYMIDFQIASIVKLLTFYKGYVADRHQGGFFSLVLYHLSAAASSLPIKLKLVIAVGGLLFAILVLLAFGARLNNRCEILALIIPPALAFAFYLSSLGVYPNWHTGYSILIQVTLIWTSCAALAGAISALNPYIPRIMGVADVGLSAVILVFSLVGIYKLYAYPPANITNKNVYVSFPSYLDHVLSPIPSGSHVLGPVEYGITDPDRAEIVALFEGLAMASKTSLKSREKVAPDFIILGPEELSNFAAVLIAGRQNVYSFQKIFPNNNYALSSMVTAPPYGTTRIYRQTPDALLDTKHQVLMRLNNGITEQWSYQSAEQNVEFEPGDPVRIHVDTYGWESPATRPQTNLRSKKALPVGNYLISLSIKRPSDNGMGAVLATNTTNVELEHTMHGYRWPVSVYLRDEKETQIIVPHRGGHMFLSHFGELPGDEISVDSVSLIAPWQRSTSQESVPLPAPSQWRSPDPNTSIQQREDGAMSVVGDARQDSVILESPEINIKDNKIAGVIVPLETLEGDLGIGVIDSDTKSWVVPPQDGTREIKIDLVGRTNNIRIAITRMHKSGRFSAVLDDGTLKLSPPDNIRYADWLTVCARQKFDIVKSIDSQIECE